MSIWNTQNQAPGELMKKFEFEPQEIYTESSTTRLI